MTRLRAPALGRPSLFAAALAFGLILAGCAAKPVVFGGATDVRSVSVVFADVPPMEVYYHRRQPPGLLGYAGMAGPMLSTVYRSWADSRKTKRLLPHLVGFDAVGEILGPFERTLREAGVFRSIERHGPEKASPDLGGQTDAVIEFTVDRWGFTYATEEKLSAEVVIVGRMRSARGDKLFWRRRLVETDGARSSLEGLASDGAGLRKALRRTLRAAGEDLARDLSGPMKPLRLKKPEL